jgi:hypothetical protein
MDEPREFDKVEKHRFAAGEPEAMTWEARAAAGWPDSPPAQSPAPMPPFDGGVAGIDSDLNPEKGGPGPL